jgi:hypothetical protein
LFLFGWFPSFLEWLYATNIEFRTQFETACYKRKYSHRLSLLLKNLK